MNYIGPNSNTTLEGRTQNSGVVTPLRGDRKSADLSSTQAGRDTVALSSQAIDMNALENTIKQSPDVNASKVVALHNKITAGEYQIDATRVAQKMIDLESRIDR